MLPRAMKKDATMKNDTWMYPSMSSMMSLSLYQDAQGYKPQEELSEASRACFHAKRMLCFSKRDREQMAPATKVMFLIWTQDARSKQ